MPLHAGNPGPLTGSGNWTYFLPGRAPLLIDAGVGAPAHLDALAQHHTRGALHVIVTHAHVDHVSGVAAIADRWPDTRFSKWPWPDRDHRYPVDWQPLADGDRVAAGETLLEVVHTPGHAPDHIALWDAATTTLFTGDLVVSGSTVVIPATGGGNLAQYLDSLRRVLALRPSRLLPAHGPAIDDPAGTIARYLEHRRERERQVLEALGSGERTVAAIAARIYPDLAEALIEMARQSVLAHLHKLEAEGVAARDGAEWRLRG